MILVLIGIQGSGKWTQWRLLQEEFGFQLFETGTALREMAQSDTPLGKEISTLIEAGEQVSPEIVEKILENAVESAQWEKLILDSFIRNEGNLISVERISPDYTAIFFDLPKEEAVKRLLGRMYNPKTGETFPAGTMTDPKTGDSLEKRKDDEEAAIQKRIDLFFEHTLPTAEKIEEKGKLIRINAQQDISSVYQELKEKLWLM